MYFCTCTSITLLTYQHQQLYYNNFSLPKIVIKIVQSNKNISGLTRNTIFVCIFVLSVISITLLAQQHQQLQYKQPIQPSIPKILIQKVAYLTKYSCVDVFLYLVSHCQLSIISNFVWLAEFFGILPQKICRRLTEIQHARLVHRDCKHTQWSKLKPICDWLVSVAACIVGQWWSNTGENSGKR